MAAHTDPTAASKNHRHTYVNEWCECGRNEFFGVSVVDAVHEVVQRGLERVDSIPAYTAGPRPVLNPLYKSAVLALADNLRRAVDHAEDDS